MTLSGLLVIGNVAVAAIVVFLALTGFGWPKFVDVAWHNAVAAWVQAIGSIGAIAVAAWVVNRQHFLQERARSDEKLDEKVAAANGMMLLLSQQLRLLMNYRSQFLEPLRSDRGRHFRLLPTGEIRSDSLRVDWTKFAYFAQLGKSNVLGELILAHDSFLTAIEAVNERSIVHRTEFQPRLEASGLGMAAGVPQAALEAAVGARVTQTLRLGTDAVYDTVDTAIKRLQEVGVSGSQALKQMFPTREVIAFASVG